MDAFLDCRTFSLFQLRSLRTLYTEDLTVVLHLSGRPVGILETSRELLFVPKDKNFRGSNRSFDGPMTGEVVNHR